MVTLSQPASPLAGLRVLDITRSVAGPWTTRLLCNAGAEVIKVEPPPFGDFIRKLPVQVGDNMSGFFLQGNSGKKSVCLDVKHPTGREVIRRLVGRSDILVQNMRPRAAERCGLTFELLVEHNPRLIMCSISGYGLRTQLVNKPGQDIGVQCLTGLSGLTGLHNGPPAIPLWSVADTVTALHAYTAICAALVGQSRGRGAAHIDLAMSRSAVQLHDVGFGLADGPSGERRGPGRFGRYHPFLMVRGVLRATDGHLGLSAFRNREWVKLARLLGEPFTEARFTDHIARFESREDITARLEAVCQGRSVEQLVRLFSEHGLRVFVLSSDMHEVTENPALVSRQALAATSPLFGSRLLGNSATVRSQGSANLLKGAPRLGEHTFEVLTELGGYEPAEIFAMYVDGVLGFDEEVLAEFLTKVDRG